jgi:hypothetical protein
MRPRVSGTERVGFSLLLTKILELTLSCVSQATQYSPSRNHKGSPTREKKVDCRLSYDSFLAHPSLQGDSVAFLATNNLQRDFNLRRVVLLWYCSCLMGA